MNLALVDPLQIKSMENYILEKVEQDRHISSYDIAQELGIDHKIDLTHLKKLEYKKLDTWEVYYPATARRRAVVPRAAAAISARAPPARPNANARNRRMSTGRAPPRLIARSQA
ncbi:hypothetical protein EVAR_83742_1 [Eumeta japonica]|uniref:Histone-lysine N-methyltransferase SETMAR n=1 Tax=Eumeta variegata TaxID=151549 RepID=A0A4C1WC37_EUMVA|nr:hypothetical protein EVAR_83742_1 [Eumeta japonica]